MKDLIKNIVKTPFSPIPKIYSSELKKIIDLLLDKNPLTRLSINNLLEMEFLHTRFNKSYIIKQEIEKKNEIINICNLTKNNLFNKSDEKSVNDLKKIKIPRNPKTQLLIDTEENEMNSKFINKEFIPMNQFNENEPFQRKLYKVNFYL